MSNEYHSPKFEIFPDDIFLVSYPKSGNTWLSFLIGNYLTNSQCDFKNFDRLIPDIYYNPEQVQHLQKPRIIKSHEPFTPEYPRVVYIVRDGRDVAVSYYFYALKFGFISKETLFEDFLLSFNQGTVGHFTSWNSHVYSWLNNFKGDLLIIKYEDMKADAARELARFLEFAGIAIDQAQLEAAVQASDFKNMQKLEEKQFQTVERFKDSDTNIHFIRSGKVGDWREFFTDQQLAEFIVCHGLALAEFNYLSAETVRSVRTIKAQLQQAQADFQQSQFLLEQSQSQQQQLQILLEQSQSQCKQLEISLEQSQSQYQQLKLKTKTQKQQLKAQLKQAQEEISTIQSSRFWKLRGHWHRLKQFIKSGGR